MKGDMGTRTHGEIAWRPEEPPGMNPIRIALYLLPGERRSLDRLVRACDVSIYGYQAGKGGVSAEVVRSSRMEGVDFGMTCEWLNGHKEVFRQVVPVYFSEDWVDLEAAGHSMGCQVERGEDIADDEAIGRSVLTNVLLTADGAVFESKRYGSGSVLQARQLPATFDGVLT